MCSEVTDRVLQVDSSVADHVIGDSFRLSQIILNLVGNAIKFTERGGVSVTVGKVEDPEARPGEYSVGFTVEDTGVGIPDDKLNLIFDAFQQADGSITRKFGGTGLGLSISKRLVNLMGGVLWVNSESGKGSRFNFTCKVKLASVEKEAINVNKQLQLYRNHQVLFVDKGQSGFGHEIGTMLKDLGLHPVIVDSENSPLITRVKAGDSFGDSLHYDAILVDSIETARALRAVDQFKYLSIVLLAPLVHVSLKACLDLGITSYLTAPFTVVDLGTGITPALVNHTRPSLAENSTIFEILLAEDNAINQRLAVQILKKNHHVVTVADNGLKAVEAVMQKRFDVILMDIQMPVMVRPTIQASKTRTYSKTHREDSRQQPRSENTNSPWGLPGRPLSP